MGRGDRIPTKPYDSCQVQIINTAGGYCQRKAPYYGNWFFIPFENLNMSLVTFKIDNEIRAVIDWMSGVKKASTPSKEMATKALNNIVRISRFTRCTFNQALIETLGFKPIIE